MRENLNKFLALDNTEKLRLDALLVERGDFESRERAQRALMAGMVFVNGQRADKPGQRVRSDVIIDVQGREKYVGRGGLKLEGALAEFAIDPTGRTAIDIGASTGGFTDCLLQHGASHVHAVDVGHGQLHWKIRQDPRVSVQEGLNCRNLKPTDIGERVWIAVADVSFISLTLILPPAFQLLEPDGYMVALIKPQFELSRNRVGKGGIVTDPEAHAEAVEKIRVFATEIHHWKWRGVIESPIRGTSGNVEFLACMQP
jgi:23S rRNA (cytidine1920-2'-O)/16S rRNA (cytidine1409-2'-O)-methyltransferase